MPHTEEGKQWRCHEISLFMLHIFVQAINNNSFMTNLFVQTPIVAVPGYFLIFKCGRLEGLTEARCFDRYLNLLIIQFIIHVGHYFR